MAQEALLLFEQTSLQTNCAPGHQRLSPGVEVKLGLKLRLVENLDRPSTLEMAILIGNKMSHGIFGMLYSQTTYIHICVLFAKSNKIETLNFFL